MLGRAEASWSKVGAFACRHEGLSSWVSCVRDVNTGEELPVNVGTEGLRGSAQISLIGYLRDRAGKPPSGVRPVLASSKCILHNVALAGGTATVSAFILKHRF